MRKLAFLIGGLLFGYGLAYSGMARPEVVLSFLQLTDFGLLLVLGVAVVITFITYHAARHFLKKPLQAKKFEKKDNPPSKNTIIGAVIFGLGWGLSGLCPGSALASIGIGNLPVLYGIGGMFLGAYASSFTNYKKRPSSD